MLTTLAVFSVAMIVAGIVVFVAVVAGAQGGCGQATVALVHAGNACLIHTGNAGLKAYGARGTVLDSTSTNCARPAAISAADGRLAAEGGRPARTTPPPPWPIYESDEIVAVAAVLASGRVNQWTGNLVGEFERSFAAYLGANFAVAVTNGSLALEVALRGLGIGPGDEVIVPCRSFIASASSVSNVGAKPVFADVDYETMLITPDTIRPHALPRFYLAADVCADTAANGLRPRDQGALPSRSDAVVGYAHLRTAHKVHRPSLVSSTRYCRVRRYDHGNPLSGDR